MEAALPKTGILTLVSDGSMLIALHAGLIAILLMAVFGTVKTKWRRARGSVSAEVARGARSMTILNVAFGVGTVALALAVQVADAAHGYKVAIIVFDYVALSYLSFFNSWSRNRLLGLVGHVYED